MTRTNYMVKCGTEGKYGMPVYRTAMKDGDKYIVKWHGRIVDVTEDVKKGYYLNKEYCR